MMVENINKDKLKDDAFFSQKKPSRKVFLNLHIMPHRHESKDVRTYSWLVAGLLIATSLIIFLMIYV
jgi:hypothetical protein